MAPKQHNFPTFSPSPYTFPPPDSILLVRGPCQSWGGYGMEELIKRTHTTSCTYKIMCGSNPLCVESQESKPTLHHRNTEAATLPSWIYPLASTPTSKWWGGVERGKGSEGFLSVGFPLQENRILSTASVPRVNGWERCALATWLGFL